MHKTVFSHIRQISVRGLINSLFIGLLTISTTQALAQTRPIKSPTELQTTQKSVNNSIAQKLLGTWETKNLQDNSKSGNLKFIFTPAGKLLIVMSSGVSQKPLVYETGYKINSDPKPMHLDVTLPENKTVQTIFEFTDDDKLKIELYESNPGQSRPKTFPDKTPLFEKVSNSTILPKYTRVIDPGRPNNNTITAPQNQPTTNEPQNNSGNNKPKK
ncbi:hypothetical protein [Mastigocoleus sp. MO_188.B34]|uniref:hypothetical protein n=1 Tax=Mastigocoleus sp. MO_188.B34 TaxID=3036635 RepID=UPI0026127913|nr:hypothetical protein [Mastigocoleus sp. MO_188.B34]MDJ0693641.1 hypothetical protein [Mastigocoleus sp. MO_188.B34]